MSERREYTESELVELVRAIDVRAPRHVHERIEAMVAERAGARRRLPGAWRRRLVAAPAACALALALVLALVLSGGRGRPALTLQRTVALTLRPATMPPPAQDPRDGAQLMVAVDGIPFPYWGYSFGLRATGARIDRVDGRSVTTVLYAGDRREWVGYAIVAGTPAPHVGGGTMTSVHGVQYRMSSADGAQVVTWLRDGRLCVVAGHGMSWSALLSLASWRGGDASAS